MKLRRAAFALGASTAMVVLIAALLPRAFLVNDDVAFATYLRMGAPTHWMSPVLNRLLAAAYHLSADVPWYGLYLYALIAATGAVLIDSCLELVDPRGGFGTVATRLGALMLVGSHVIVAAGVTWTAVSISALGTAMAAFVAHLESSRAAGTQASPLRAVIYGLLLAAGFALRENGLLAGTAALLPVLGWAGIRFLRRRHLPRPTALIAFVAPIALVVAIQHLVPQAPGTEYEEFNGLRGWISGEAAFEGLDTRAPEVLERAGWTLDEYRDFSNWLLADDTEFSVEKLRRLVDTGGLPTSKGAANIYGVVRGIASDSPASVSLFLTTIAGGILLAWLGGIARRRAAWFSLGNLVFLTVVPVMIAATSRFPQRVSMSFYTVAAFGMFVVLATEIASSPPRADGGRRPVIALSVITVFMLVWARHLIAWADREPWPYHATLRAFADRVKARGGIVMGGRIEMDPLLADAQGFDALPSGWGTFTAPWFDYIHRFGIHSGSELLHRMVDNPNAYVVSWSYGNETFVDWIRRRTHNPAVRLALVDSAGGMPWALRSDLFRLVTTPLVRGSDEWQLLTRNLAAAYEELPGPPAATDRRYRAVAFTAPFDHHVSRLRRVAAGISVEPTDGGIRCTVPRAADTSCLTPGKKSERAGIHVAVDGLGAARFDLTLIDPENITAVHIQAQAESSRSIHWRWDLAAPAQQFGFSGAITVVGGHPAHQFALVESGADARDIRELHVFIDAKPGTHAGFELRHLEVAEP